MATQWGRMEILQAEKHQNLTQWSGIPILVCDVWEHAYYLDIRTEDRICECLVQLVNWNEVERRLISAMSGKVALIIEDKNFISSFSY